jgi:quercetin dioxygenase-like cupin family protein
MRTAIRSPLLALALMVVFAGGVLATAASNLALTPLSRGTISERVHVKADGIRLKTNGPVDVVTVTITLGTTSASGSSGWHAHPGVALVTVQSGSVVEYDEDCEATVQAAGSAFVESGHDAVLVRNESTTTPAVLYVTFIVPKGTTATRIDNANPGCPQN